MKTKITKKKNHPEDINNRFKIMFVLINSENPLKLADIWKQAGLSEQLASHHLKNLIEDCLVFENDDKTYLCQPFFQDEHIMEDIDALMEVIVRTVFYNLEIPESISKKEIEKIVQANLQIYIQMFGIE